MVYINFKVQRHFKEEDTDHLSAARIFNALLMVEGT
jgi:hypothetical protein